MKNQPLKKEVNKKHRHNYGSGDCCCGQHSHNHNHNDDIFKRFENENISFLYPSNWQLEHTALNGIDDSIQLSNNSGSFWFLKKYPFGTNPEAIAREAVAAMEAEYKEIETEPFEKQAFGKIITGFDISFFYLDLVNSAKVLCFEDNGLVYAVFWQTGNQLLIRSDDSLPVEDVLEAITHSLFAGFAE
ncbi:hypothetical protein FACS189427_07800 [Planctomycetales bacterium]|nr:hypothetical protein FACS1894214_5310 [Planctomycetales bacterium]GHT36354.1 hypothetical protein FACS189427_07800 [Planctomycetales bacterium]